MYKTYTHQRVLALALLCALSLTACDDKKADAQAASTPAGQGGAALPAEKTATTEPVTPSAPPPLQALDGAHFSTFNLLHNRPAAHRVERVGEHLVLAIDASKPDFVRYIHGNHPNEWILDAKDSGETGAGAKGTKASMWVPALRTSGPQAIAMRVFNNSPNGNGIKVKLGGKESSVVTLEKGWQTVVIALPDGVLKEENAIDLLFTNMGRVDGKLAGGIVSWMRIGPAAAFSKEKDELAKLSAPVDLVNAQDSVSLSKTHGLAYFMWPQPKSKLALTLEGDEGCGVQVTAFVEDGKGGTTQAFSEERVLVKGRGKKQETAIDLSGAAGAKGQVARVELVTAGSCEAPLVVSRAEQVLPGERPERPADIKKPKYILFWMIDTLRADHVPWIGKTNVETPEFTKLADNGVVFMSAFVQGNESKASHASLFSGLYPVRHKVLGSNVLKPEMELMTEAIQKTGYKTCGHSANGWISAPLGFVQGWDSYANTLRDVGGALDGMTMARYGMQCFKQFKDKPLFVYIGTIDPHVTYRGHGAITEKYDDGPKPYTGRFQKNILGEDLGKIKGGGLKVDERDKTRIKALYKGEIEFNDQAFGKLRKFLEEEGIWDETMVIVTSDHGDEFWERGSVGHGHSIYQDQVHVPLLVHYPPLFKKQQVEVGVDILDIYPMIIDLLGHERPKKLQGKSFLPIMFGQTGMYPEPAIATQYLLHHTLRLMQWKVYLRRGTFELYDAVSDPTELKDIKSKHPLASRWTLDAMSQFRAYQGDWDKLSWGVPGNLSADFVNLTSNIK